MIFSILLIIIVIISIRKQKILEFNVFLFASILYMFVFGIVPIILEVVEIPYYYDRYWSQSYNKVMSESNSFTIDAQFYSLVGYLFLLLGYRVSRFKQRDLLKINPTNINLVNKIALFAILLGVVIFAIYLNSFGSIKQGFLSNNRMLFRNDRVDVDTSVSYFKGFSRIVVTATFLMWGVWQQKKTRQNRNLFLLGISASLAYLFYNSGRLSVINFIFILIMASSILKNHLPKLKITIGIVVAFVMTVVGKSIFRFFLYDDALSRSLDRLNEYDPIKTSIFDFIGDFTFPYYSLVAALGKYDDWLIFKDLIFSFTYLFPASLFPTIEDAALFNTKNIHGVTVTAASIPSDILTYGYLNLGIIGMLLMPLLFGIVCKWVDSFNRKTNPVSLILLVNLVFIIGFRVLYFFPKHLLKGDFSFIFVFTVLYFSLRFYKKIKLRI